VAVAATSTSIAVLRKEHCLMQSAIGCVFASSRPEIQPAAVVQMQRE
jgi:hypothetical protein